MLKISYAAFLYLPQLVSAQFALEICLAAEIAKKSIKTPYFSVQSHPRSLNLVAIESQCTIYSNLDPISQRHSDTATYWLKITIFPTLSHLAPSLGVTPFKFMEKLYGS